MGAVYKVRDATTGVVYALKILEKLDPEESGSESRGRPGRDGDAGSGTDGGSARRKLPKKLRRFLREGRAHAVADAHPNVVRIHSGGALPDGRPYLVLEWLGGGSLADLVEEAPLPTERVVAIIGKLAGALDWIHELGLVHRDLKPGNVMFDEAGEPRITDFGLVRTAQPSSTGTALTRSGAAVGTPFFMAPEQVVGDLERIGPATDIWALGVILYQLLTGKQPFEATSLPQLFYAIQKGEPPAPSRHVEGLPTTVDAVCARVLAKDPAERYARAGELADDLRRALTGETVSAVGHLARRRRRTLLARLGVVAAVGLVLALLGLGWWATGSRSTPPDRATVSTTTGPVAPLEAAAALAAGDPTCIGELVPDAVDPRLRAAFDALAADPPDLEGAVAALATPAAPGAPEHALAGAVLRALLLGVAGRGEEADAALADPRLADGPLPAAVRSRRLADLGRSVEAGRLLRDARAAATPLGLDASVRRLAEGLEPTTRWLARRSVALAVLAARTRREELEVEADRVATALTVRDPESGVPAMARARAHWERRDDGGVVAEVTSALERRLTPADRGALLLLRGESRLRLGSAGAAREDARAAAEADRAIALDASLLEVEAAVAQRDPGAVDAARAAIDGLEALDGSERFPPRPWQDRLWRARTLLARALAGAGAPREAAEITRRIGVEWSFALNARTSIPRFGKVDDVLAADPGDDAVRFVRGRMRVHAGPGSPAWRPGIQDMVRVAQVTPPAILAWRGYHDIASLIEAQARRQDIEGRAALEERPASEDALVSAVSHLADGVGTLPARAARALPAADRALDLDPVSGGAWLVRGYALFALGRSSEAARSLAIAAALAPDAGEIAAYQILCDPAVGAGGRAVDRLLLLGVDQSYLDKLLTDPGVRGRVDASAAERLAGFGRSLEAIEAFERVLPWIARAEGGPQLRDALAELAASAPPDDDAMAAHFVGAAGMVQAQMASEDNDPAAAQRAYARAAVAFAAAAGQAERARASESALVHRAAAARAAFLGGRIDARLLARFDACVDELRTVMPRGRTPFTFAGLEDSYVFTVSELHLFAHSEASLLAHRALVRRRLGDLEGAVDDAERAVMMEPAQAAVLTAVYEAVADGG